MSFTRKEIDLTITLGTGEFGADLGDTVTITGARIMCSVANPGGESMGYAQISVWGLQESTMNKLTTIGQINRATRIKNTVSVAAGDADGKQLVFFGVISDAWADYNSSPEVPFNIVAYAGLDIALKPVGATAYKGSINAATILQKLAEDAGLAFENNGVSVQLDNAYLPGTTLDKIRSCARAAGILFTIDRGTLAIWPQDGYRQGEKPLISKDTGLVGYPSLSSKGMDLKMVFNWNIKLGGTISVETPITMANGDWTVFNVSHQLSCMVPDGPWFTFAEVYRVEQ